MKTVAVFSTKGGTGKSTIACGLALALQRAGLPIGLLDLDFAAPDINVMLQIKDKPQVGKGTIVPVMRNGLKVFSWGMIWPAHSAVQIEDKAIEDEDLERAIELIEAGKGDFAVKHLRRLIAHPGGSAYYIKMLLQDGVINWGDAEWMIVDTPPQTTGVIRALVESNIYGAILVTHPSSVSLADVTRTADLFAKRKVPVYGVVSNQGMDMLGRERYDRQESDVKDWANEQGLNFLMSIPHARAVVLEQYFDRLADYVIGNKPVLLERKTPVDTSIIQELSAALKMLDALRAFGKEEVHGH